MVRAGRIINCDGCRFCCWSFNVHDVPDLIKGFELKPAREHCRFECDKGCELHSTSKLPQACREFLCPYLGGEIIHRPDTFQNLLEEMDIGLGNFIPAIPAHIPVATVENLIRENRTIPAFILIGNEWIKVILSLDREDAKTWIVSETSVKLWDDLFGFYGAENDSTIEPGTLMIG